MKRIATILFTLFYLSVTAGISVNFHYCSGKVKSVELFAYEGKCCCGGKEIQSRCCHNETILLQLNDIQLISNSLKTNHILKITGLEINSNPIIEQIKCISSVDERHIIKKIPVKNPIWLVNCELTYYG